MPFDHPYLLLNLLGIAIAAYAVGNYLVDKLDKYMEQDDETQE